MWHIAGSDISDLKLAYKIHEELCHFYSFDSQHSNIIMYLFQKCP